MYGVKTIIASHSPDPTQHKYKDLYDGRLQDTWSIYCITDFQDIIKTLLNSSLRKNVAFPIINLLLDVN